MCKQYATLLVIVLLCGCTSPIEKLTDKYYVLNEEDENKLDGPYKVKDVSPNTILVEKDKKEIKIILRGCIPTNDPKINSEAESGLGSLIDNDAYLLRDSVVWLNSKEAKAIVYKPANRVWIGHDENGKDIFRNLSYRLPQLIRFTYGQSLLDHSDTDYPLYEVFKEAEKLAKENKKGYWATHPE